MRWRKGGGREDKKRGWDGKRKRRGERGERKGRRGRGIEEYSIRYNNSLIYNITPFKHQHETQPDTLKHITPQPSTPIKHAGSDLEKDISKHIQVTTRIL